MFSSAAFQCKLRAREAVARARFEAYEAWQRARWRREEITDQAERLAAPMNTPFRFYLKPEGLVNDQGESLLNVQINGCAEADRMAEINPDWQFEAARRWIEAGEIHDLERFARGEIEAEALVVMSPIPDAVIYSGIDIGAYDPERRKMLARVVTRTEDGILISHMSLDQSNYQGMQAIAAALGHEMSEGLTSEEILQSRWWVNTPVEHLDLVRNVRQAYDSSLTQQFGGEWYAGREPTLIKDAYSFIEQQTDLIDEHMGIVARVRAMENDRDKYMAMLAPHRYNLAAALDARRTHRNFKSMAEAGDHARAQGKSFDGDCPVGIGQSPSAASQLESLGYAFGQAGIDKCVNCPFCKRVVDARRKAEVNPLTNKFTITYECLSSGCKIDTKTGQRIDKELKARRMGKKVLATVGR